MSLRTAASLLASLGAVALALWLSTLPQEPRADFDVLGVAWLLGNLRLLVGWGAVGVLAALALCGWVTVLLRRLGP